MWPSKMKVERLIAEARTLHGLVPRAEDQPNRSLKTGRKSSAMELAPKVLWTIEPAMGRFSTG